MCVSLTLQRASIYAIVIRMAINAIQQQLRAAQQELDTLNAQIHDLERRRDIVAGRVEAFDLAAKYIAEMPGTERTRQKAQKGRVTTPSSDWQRIFRELFDRYRAGFGYDEIIGVAGALNVEVVRSSLRSKMMNLANNNNVERVDNGRFRITNKGVEYFGIVRPEKNEAPPLHRVGLL